MLGFPRVRAPCMYRRGLWGGATTKKKYDEAAAEPQQQVMWVVFVYKQVCVGHTHCACVCTGFCVCVYKQVCVGYTDTQHDLLPLGICLLRECIRIGRHSRSICLQQTGQIWQRNSEKPWRNWKILKNCIWTKRRHNAI